jgi:hypothetical protein
MKTIAGIICIIAFTVWAMFRKTEKITNEVIAPPPFDDQAPALYSVQYQIDLNINNDRFFGYISFNSLEAAQEFYAYLLTGSYQNGNDFSRHTNLYHEPSIALHEQVIDKDDVIRAEKILNQSLLGDELIDPRPIEPQEKVMYDHIGYYKETPSRAT